MKKAPLTPWTPLSGPKTLGVAVTLEPGEWIQSAISRWAWRLEVPRRSLLEFFGLETLTTAETAAIGNHPRSDVAENISAATGIDVSQIYEACMSTYNGGALTIPTQSPLETRAISRNTPYPRLAGTRFCPLCLREQPSVMRTAWRLNWTFACVTHRLVLHDNCPNCHQPVKEMRYGNLDVFDPASCRQPTGSAEKNRYCGYPLADAEPSDHLNLSSPVVAAQRAIDAKVQHPGGLEYLARIRAYIAALRAAGGIERLATLAEYPEGDLLGIIEPEEHAGAAAPDNALAMAVLSAGAVRISEQSDGYQHQLLRQVTFDRTLTRAGNGVELGPGSAQDVLSHYPGAARFADIRQQILRAHDEDLSISQRLLWGSATPKAVRDRYRELPPDDTPYEEWIHRTAPSGFWDAWTVRLDATQRSIGHAFPTGLRLALKYVDIWEVRSGERSRPPAQGISRVLRPSMLGSREQTTQLLAALGELRLWLRGNPSPIDYRRRRTLPTRFFLPHEHWRRIAESTETNVGRETRVACVRRYLYQRVTSAGEGNKWWTPGSQVSTPDYTAFLISMTSELQQQLDHYALALLEVLEIEDEPVVWSPPAFPLELGAPGRELSEIDTRELHERLRGGERRQTVLANLLGVSQRHLLAAIDDRPPSSGAKVDIIGWTRADWFSESF